MLISYNWIQKYFSEPIPKPKELADIITMGAFEIDGIEDKGEGNTKDTILDVKVLPDRSSYALSHRYMAQEIGALISKKICVPEIHPVDISDSVAKLVVSNEAGSTPSGSAFCRRYAGRIVEGVVITESPAWLKNQLEALGQRSINSIVDLTNYIMLETGQPLHAFDADKVEGPIRIRKAKDAEEITLLDGTVLKLNSTMLVIADDIAPLALAGIKGGKKAEVTKETKNLILEAACFDASTTRKTAQTVGIKNDSSKRFENGVTPERAGLALAMLSDKIFELNPAALFGEVADEYQATAVLKTLEVSVAYITERLGIAIPKETIIDILSRVDITARQSESSGDLLVVSIPEYRPDLQIAEDIIEEVGRIYGYDKIVGVVPSPEDGRRIQKNFYYHNAIRKTLIELGFSELYTYTLTEQGDTKLANPLSVERAYLRNNLSELMVKKSLFNLKNIDLLGLKEVRVFEIGKVFGGGVLHERNSLALSIARAKQPKGHDPKIELEAIVAHVFERIGAPADTLKCTFTELKGDAQTPCTGFVAEIDLDSILALLPDQKEDFEMNPLPQVKFKTISPYPFAVRDIAVFVPGEKGQEGSVLATITSALESDSENSVLVRATLFDVFTKNKEGEPVQTSYAYRLVFQSDEKTLLEDEINLCMKKVTDAFVTKGWSVR